MFPSTWKDIYGMEWSVRQLRKIADDQGAFLVKPHPLRDGDFIISSDGFLAPGAEDRLALFDALEVMNGGESATANSRAAVIAQTYSLKGTAGSDVHVAAGVGRYATRFTREIRSESDLVAELKAGRFTTVDFQLPIQK